MKNKVIKALIIAVCAAVLLSAVPFTAFARTTDIYVSAEEIDSYGAAYAIQNALYLAEQQGSESNIVRVTVEPGEYVLDYSLHIYGNTWLKLDGVTLSRGARCQNMLRTGDDDGIDYGVTGYYYKNITIEGGTFDGMLEIPNTMFKISHAKNYVMKNVTLKNNKNAHMMEVAAVDGFTAEGCNFYDQLMDTGNVGYEVIQFDVLKYGNIGGCRSEDLCMKNVLIENCVFDNVPRGVGSHTAVHNNPHDTLIIRNNTFTNIGSVAVQTLGWANCSISNNIIDGAPRAIAVYSIVSEGYGTILPSVLAAEGNTEQHFSDDYFAQKSNILIANNLITNSGIIDDKYAGYEKAAVSVLGSKVVSSASYSGGSGGLPAGEYPCDTVTVKNNLIYSKSGSGVRVEHSKNISVDSNVMFLTQTAAPPNYCGIVFRDGVNPANITKNYIQNAAVNGIQIDSSLVNYITGNEIIGTGKYGIGVYNSTFGLISNNDIRNTKSEGISILSASRVNTGISGNRVSGTGTGIHVDSTSAVKLVDKNLTYNCKSNISYASSMNLVNVGTNYTANAALTTFAVDSKAVNLNVGECRRIGRTVTPVNAITTFSFASSNPDAVIVDSTGRITAKAPGTANITVRSANGKALIITVKVADLPGTLPGDVDGDGIVTSADSALLGNYTSGIGDDGIVSANADVTGDGKITALDRIALTRYANRADGFTALPIGASGTAVNGCSVSVDNAKPDDFGEVEVGINLIVNPGIATADFDVEFNSNVLELTEVVNNRLFDSAVAAHSDKMQSPYRLSWQNDVAESNYTAAGKLVTLRFKVKENAEPGVYNITVNPKTAEVYNKDLYLVPCAFTGGTVEIDDVTVPKAGDVDRSGIVDADDALLLQKHIARFTVGGVPLLDETDEETMNIADVNRDGSLTISDVTMIQQYIAEIIELQS